MSDEALTLAVVAAGHAAERARASRRAAFATWLVLVLLAAVAVEFIAGGVRDLITNVS